jgi:hypothetical protein
LILASAKKGCFFLWLPINSYYRLDKGILNDASINAIVVASEFGRYFRRTFRLGADSKKLSFIFYHEEHGGLEETAFSI